MSVQDRFLHYITFDTQSDPSSSSAPSTSKQLILAKELAQECEKLGLQASVDPYGIVYATLEASDEALPSLGFCAHMDTASELSGKDVKARIIKNYQGNTIQLNEEYSMSPEDYPALKDCMGDDLIVTDGTTLLGGDDKAGIAIIMQAVSDIIDQNLPHGKVQVAFTPDEEVGRGVENFDLDRFKVDYAYTVDGGKIDQIDYENFNAAQAVIKIEGKTIHPGYAKDKMINASLLATEFIQSMPKKQTPAHTEKRQGFYHLVTMQGSCEEAVLTYILRHHDWHRFLKQKEFMKSQVEKMNEKYPGRFHLELHDQYYNMKQYMHGDMRCVQRARKAIRLAGMDPVSIATRGGTDGAMLTEKGLICPNLGTGTYHHHGRYEFASIQQMEKMVEIVKHIICTF